MPFGINMKDVKSGCKRLGGNWYKHDDWQYTCDINDELLIGINISGLVEVFDWRNGINEIHMRHFDNIDVGKDVILFKARTGDIRIGPTGNGKGIEVNTNISPLYYGKSLEEHKKGLAHLASSRFDVPEGSILRMRAPFLKSRPDWVTKIDWELPKNNVPLLVADGVNMIKGTVADFSVPSVFTPAYEATLEDVAKKTEISFRIGDELKMKQDDFDEGYMKPPMCIPVGSACYARHKVYKIFEEILQEELFDEGTGLPYKDLVEKGETVRYPVFQSKKPEFAGLLRIPTPSGVDYLLAPDGWLPTERS
jgi:hypothetical protein